MRTLLVSSLAALFFCCPIAARGQNDGHIHVPDAVQQGPDTRPVPIRSGDEMDQEAAARMRDMRQEEIKSDTAKLYELSGELKQYVDKNDQNVLSLDMVKKAQEIEKLAHSVRKKIQENQ